MKNRFKMIKVLILFIIIFSLSIVTSMNKEEMLTTNSQVVSNKKICWGIKREENHKQPDLGSTNQKILEQ